MTKIIHQFGVKYHPIPKPEGMPYVDCRILPNPFVKGVSDAELKVRVTKLLGFDTLVQRGVKLLETNDEISIFCLFGKHRSGAVAEEEARLTGAKIKRFEQ